MNWINCISPERFGVAPDGENIRSQYERDYDRIIYSSAFRRLQNKTQVFPLPEYVFVHNRLTHSLEVVSVGRSLGKIVGENIANEDGLDATTTNFYRNQLKDVVAAACLAHDLGNPAFGHSGEEAISKYFTDQENNLPFRSRFNNEEWEDLTHFEGNANALRILTKQFNGRLEGGYRLTYPTLASILKYPCESTAKRKDGRKHRSKYGFFQSDKNTFQAIVDKLHMQKEEDKPLAYFRHPFVFLVEAADDICYNIIDFEDAHRLKILTTAEVKEAFMEIIRKNPNEDLQKLEQNLKTLSGDANESIAYLRAKAINYLTISCARVFIDHKEAILKGEFNSSLIDCCEDVRSALDHIGEQSVKRIYNHDSVIKIELAGFKIMSGLVEDLVEAILLPKDQRSKRHKKILSLMPHQYQVSDDISDYEKVMSILDYVSGMTDLYALELYRNLRGISVPQI